MKCPRCGCERVEINSCIICVQFVVIHVYTEERYDFFGSSDKCVGEAAVRIAHLRDFVHGRKYAEARK